MLIPARVIELYAANPFLHQPPSQQAIVRKGDLPGFRPVELMDFLRLLADVHQPWNTRLHPVAQLEGLDPGPDLRIPYPVKMTVVHPVDQVELAPAHPGINPGRVRQKEHGVALGTKLHSLVPAGKKTAAPVVCQEGLQLDA